MERQVLWLTLLALGIGVVAGWIGGRRTNRLRARLRSLEAELEASRAELESYREQVGEHFSRTSDLLQNLTLQYREVYTHLAEGARTLCPDHTPALEEGLEAALLAAESELAATPLETEESTEGLESGHDPVKGVLFLCSGNSCRSQMAEGFARHMASDDVAVFSAGTEPVGLNPRAVRSMAEVGIDISQQSSKPLAEIPLGSVDTVVTLCGDAAERCPSFPAGTRKLHWKLPDPARAQGSEAEVQRAFREVRGAIEARVRSLLGASPVEQPSSSAS